ncbi:hypothetical protein [Mycobacteroides abscessus]|uniref:hypothetical protein n=1 Tax=Mycobacteroides abscessus TaxID=36809 RepID=UPI0013F62528|nr:hypothetical protein [Mycobacteroides abscessus]
MVAAEFEEKQFEDCHKEILCRTPGVSMYPVGQVLENVLGVDARAMLPPNHPLWSVIGVTYGHGQCIGPDIFPDRYANVFLQYKRSNYFPAPRSKYSFDFEQKPYYGFKVSPPSGQWRTLIDLSFRIDNSIDRLGVVRYVAPRFHTHNELWNVRDDGTILERSIYVAPEKFESAGRPHTSCFYSADVAEPVIFNSEPERGRVEEFTEFVDSIPTGTPRDLIVDLSRIANIIDDIDGGKSRARSRREELRFDRLTDYVSTIGWFAYVNSLQWILYLPAD